MATYTVKRGDTLSEIAKKYGVSIATIKQANADLIKNINLLEIGWKLYIPTSDQQPIAVKPPKDYAAVVKQLEKVLEDIEKLSSFIVLERMLK